MKLNKEILEELEKHFPKGDKSRGKALVLHSVAQIKLNGIFKDIEKAIEKTKSDVPVPINESRFLIELNKIKEKYLDEHP